MKKGLKISESIAGLFALISAMAFSSKHHIWGIWLGVAAGCFIIIGIGFWLTIGGESPVINPSEKEQPIAPLSITPADLPPSQSEPPKATPAPESSNPMSEPKQTFNVTSNNQVGGITAGQVMIGQQPRTLTSDQQQSLSKDISGKVKTPIRFLLENTAQDATSFVPYIGTALEMAGCTTDHNVLRVTGQPPVRGMWVTSDPVDSPDMLLIVSALRKGGINAHSGGVPTPWLSGMQVSNAKDTITIWIGQPE